MRIFFFEVQLVDIHGLLHFILVNPFYEFCHLRLEDFVILSDNPVFIVQDFPLGQLFFLSAVVGVFFRVHTFF